MITFILNDSIVRTEIKPGTTLLDFIRYENDLPGTKIGCREGDCGACTVLEGSLDNDKVAYKSIVSCLTPLGSVQGKHIVTIEGLNMKELSPVQSALVEHSGTQCGFCTPGFVVSLSCHCLAEGYPDSKKIIDAISGNICRCTGYKSIERAAESISALLKNKDISNPVKWLTDNKFIPSYFNEIPSQLKQIAEEQKDSGEASTFIGGGTDLMVQKPEEIAEKDLSFLSCKKELKGISVEGDRCTIKASSTASEIMHSEAMNNVLPGIKDHFKLVSSEQIRNMGTIAGNIVNASPIADLSIFFLSLNPELTLTKDNKKRTVLLKKFFLGYKQLDLKEGEIIESLSFKLPRGSFYLNFEKVSKRTYLDIASVNSACYIRMAGSVIDECGLATGGVSPVPLFLEKTSSFLIGKEINNSTISNAMDLLQEEISPISDVRGTEQYKRLLAGQLFIAHFEKLFPEKISIDKLLETVKI